MAPTTDDDRGMAPATPAGLVPLLGSDRRRLSISALQPGDSPRHRSDARHIQRLAACRSSLPPIVVHRQTMRVIDGMHRLQAAQARGDQHIDVVMFDGASADAFVLSVGLNCANGRPLTTAERAGAAMRILRSHPDWSNRLLAVATGLAASTVAVLRERSTAGDDRLNGRLGQDGRVRPVDPAGGRLRATAELRQHPEATLREVARAARVSVATAKDVRDRLRRGEHPLPPRLRSDLARRSSGPPGPVAPAAPAAAVAPDGSGRSGPAPRAAMVELFAALARDPSLRTLSGRAVLRMVAGTVGVDLDLRSVARAVPEHRRLAMAELARWCAQRWSELAAQLEPDVAGGRQRP